MPVQKAIPDHVQVAVGSFIRHIVIEGCFIGRLYSLRKFVNMTFAFFYQFVPGASCCSVIIGPAVLPVDPFTARIDQSCGYHKRNLFGYKAEAFKIEYFHWFQNPALQDARPVYFDI